MNNYVTIPTKYVVYFATIIAALLAMQMPAEARHNGSQSAIYQFRKHHDCPSTGNQQGACPGYVIDHIYALACGGPDLPDNMQWQTKADAKLKDKWERIGCTSR